ncbi:unnamed protein product [Aphis gossypii]|uniref:Calponin-homology (CH) domain-containing protein n=1 Tax=Aphis gossypii TaxID=80765 RepID=A0A9P0J7A9_APHGO|nr:unnamed protein product [Aphis gossypii]
MPMWDGEFGGEQVPNDKGPTPKQRLLNWIQSKVPDIPISNFTTDWNDGKAVGALVDAVAPGLCPDWQDWKSNNALKNASEAMGLADDWLNIKQLIKPEELVSPNMDEQSMMTYLSQYPNAKLKQGAPIRSKTNPSRVRVYGPGIEPSGPVVGAKTNFTVETFSAGKGTVNVTVENPKGKAEPVDLVFNNDRSQTYTATYKPIVEGPHKVHVNFSGVPTPKSPYHVNVDASAGDPNKVNVFGPGIQPEGVFTSRPTYFEIHTKDAGKGVPEVIILDPAGRENTIPVKLKKEPNGVYICDYTPVVQGVHSVNVFFANQPIPLSPFAVGVSNASDAKRVRAFGRGIQPHGLRVQDEAKFKIVTEGAGEGVPDVNVIGPGGVKEPVNIKKLDAHTYEATYYPRKVGRHVVMVTFGGVEIPKAPFEVHVTPFKETLIRAYGPGLTGGVVSHPAMFTVETNGETGSLGFSIEGPSKAKIDCQDNGDGSADVRYYPMAPGEYAVHILCDNEDIPKSPYMANVVPSTDFYPDKVNCYGSGLQPNGVIQGKPAEFVVDTKKAGVAPLDVKSVIQYFFKFDLGVFLGSPTDFSVDSRAVAKYGQGVVTCTVTNPSGSRTETFITPQSDGTYKISYTPFEEGPHTIDIYYDGVPIVGSPFSVNVKRGTDASKCRAFGPGLTKGIINKVNAFTVETKGAGTGSLGLAIEGPSEAKMTCKDNRDGSCSVEYTPTESGDYDVSIQFAEKHIPGSPFKVTVDRPASVNDIKVSGPGINPKYCRANTPITFKVDASKSAKGNVDVKMATDKGPLQQKPIIRDNEDGTYDVTYTPNPEGALLTANVLYNGHQVPDSPFKLRVRPKFELDKIKIEGPGVSDSRGVKASVPTYFVVDATDAGSGKLDLRIMGPDGFPRPVDIEKKDNLYKIKYTPDDCGRYTIDALYDGKPLPQSPIHVQSYSTGNAENCRIMGNVESRILMGRNHSITVNARNCGDGNVTCRIRPVDGHYFVNTEVLPKNDGTYVVNYSIKEPGDYTMTMKYGGQPVRDGFYKFTVTP